MVNDGSTDNTAQVMAAFEARDPRFRAVNKSNEGVSITKNLGIAMARAERVMFLDGDDWLSPHYIERMLGALARNPSADLSYCGFHRVPPEGWQLPVEFAPEVAKRPFEVLSTRCAFASDCVVLPRQLLLDLGGFDTSLVTSEDWDLWLRIARTGARFVGVPEGLAYYRARPGSATSRYLQMIADLRVVMARAQAPDPRVKNPHPRYAKGVRIPEPELRVLASALLLAGVECVNGRAGAPALEPLEPLPDCTSTIEDHCRSLVHGLSFTRPAFAVVEVWTQLEPHLLTVCERLAQACRPGVDPKAMVRRIACLIAEQCDLKTPQRLGAIYARELRLDAPLPSIMLPDGADHLYLRLYYGAKPLGDVCVAAGGSLSHSAVESLVFGALGVKPGHWLSLPLGFAVRTLRSMQAVLVSKKNRKARFLTLVSRLGDNFAAAVHLTARKQKQTAGHFVRL
jgi:hypothetical protein